VTDATFGAPTLNTDGGCMIAANRTITIFNVTTTTTVGGGSPYNLYMTDCNDKILQQTLGITGTLSAEPRIYIVSNPPDCAPFQIFASNDRPTIPSIFTGTKIGLIEFDPSLLDDDCPAVPAPVPTLSQWGLIILGLFLTIFGVVAVRQTLPQAA